MLGVTTKNQEAAPDRIIIGLCLYHGQEQVERCVALELGAQDFGDLLARAAWSRMADMCSRSRCIDLLTVPPECPEIQEGWFHLCVDEVRSASVHHSAELVAQMKKLRRKRELLTLVTEWGKQIPTTAANEIDDSLAEIAAGVREIQAPEILSPTIAQLCDKQTEEWYAPKPDQKLLGWPLGVLQNYIGYVEQDVIYIGSKRSVGKTALALNWLASLAQGGTRIAMRSLESPTTAIIRRLVASMAVLDIRPLKEHTASEFQKQQAAAALERIKTLPISINDHPATIETLRVWAQHQKQEGAQILLIDNMRHIRPTREYKSPIELFRDHSLRLKWIRDDVKLPMVILHHTSDEGKLAWSRDIENDADIVLILERPNEPEDNADEQAWREWAANPMVYIGITKNREGRAGDKLAVYFDKTTQTFKDRSM